jgi:hypothetical protein
MLMKKQILFSIVVLVILFFSACKVNNEPIEKIQPVYLPLAVGNYWIYQHFSIDSTGKESPLSLFDSVVITKETMIHGQLYFEFGGTPNNNFLSRFLRDSLGYLVTDDGKKVFSMSNFTDTISKSEYFAKTTNDGKLHIFSTLKIKMESIPKLISTPAGEFKALVAGGFRTNYYYGDSGFVNEIIKTSQNTYYSQNVGIILDSYHYYSDFKDQKRKFEKRLVRYKINN